MKKIIFSIFIFNFTAFQFTSCIEPETKTAYITQVFEYVYAPGQHAEQAKYADIQYFIGNPENHNGWLYLGGFGGYVIAGFDHSITNHNGNDFEVYALRGQMPEPAIVYVMSDTNDDSKPNEIWYELKGSQYLNSKRNYWVRYYKALTDSANITSLDSDGNRSELHSGFGSNYTSGWWWPNTKTDSVTFIGTRLPDAYVNNGTNGSQYWTVPTDRFSWGYAENLVGTDYDSTVGSNKFDISNAIDNSGNPIQLNQIRFIKVQSGVFQQAGWTNEVSSELRGARELINDN